MRDAIPRTHKSIRYTDKTLREIEALQAVFPGRSRDSLVEQAITEMAMRYAVTDGVTVAQSLPEPKEFMTLPELADHWGVNRQTVYNLVRQPDSPLKPVSNSSRGYLFERENVESITPPKPRAKRSGLAKGDGE